jgi:arabinogalactan oligomer / maltooligosaccharide transport system permease protein
MRTFKADLWRHAVAWVLILFTVFPIYVVIASSVDSSGQLLTNSLWPTNVGFENFELLFANDSVPFLTWIKNSLIVATVTALGSVFMGASAAYAFSRLKFKGRKVGIQTLLLIQVFPSFLAISAIFVIMGEIYRVFPAIGLGTTSGLILIYLGGAMGVNAWLLKGFIDSIPAELDESAKIDGATPSQIYWLIFFPLAAPVLAVVALLSFIGTFNEFILASLFLNDIEQRTVAVGLQQFIGNQFDQNWGPFAAGSLIASIPIVIIFLSLQKYIIGGLTSGSVKG